MNAAAPPATPRAKSAAPAAVFVDTFELGGEGPRVAIKDSIDIAGHPTRVASSSHANAPPALRHAAVVQALLDGGCRIVGKTNMHELAYGVTGINAYTGTPVNPRYPDRIPGGSSSGSAVAVAAGLVDFAIGTDTGGSIRIPAACCGVYGLKPTYGRVSRIGVHPSHSSLDCVGPFARDLAMLEHAMTLMDPTFSVEPRPTQMRLGVVTVTADAPIEAAVRQALAVVEGDGDGDGPIETTPIHLPSFEAAYAAGITIIGAENWQSLGHLTESQSNGAACALGADVLARLLAARDVTPEQVLAAEACRVRFRAEVDAALEHVDALALPTLPIEPLTLAAAADARASLRLTAWVRVFNLSGHPALTIPLETDNHLPAGLQLVGRRMADANLCAVAQRVIDRMSRAHSNTPQDSVCT